jgi:hypothetical protein
MAKFLVASLLKTNIILICANTRHFLPINGLLFDVSSALDVLDTFISRPFQPLTDFYTLMYPFNEIS